MLQCFVAVGPFLECLPASIRISATSLETSTSTRSFPVEANSSFNTCLSVTSPAHSGHTPKYDRILGHCEQLQYAPTLTLPDLELTFTQWRLALSGAR